MKNDDRIVGLLAASLQRLDRMSEQQGKMIEQMTGTNGRLDNLEKTMTNLANLTSQYVQVHHIGQAAHEERIRQLEEKIKRLEEK